MASKKKKVDYKILYIAGIFIIVMMLAINAGVNRRNNTVEEIDYENMTEEEIIEEENQNNIEELQGMEERDRMEFYFGMFLDYVENEEYSKAYDLLYDEFKQNYFPTLEDFEKYAKETFPEMANVEHENIERNGDVYVLWITITDVLNGRRDEGKEMNFVIQENDYNDFVLSFSVI